MMKNKIVLKSFLAFVMILASISACLCAFTGCTDNDVPANGEIVWQDQKTDEKIKNVIFLIPDGAGYPTYDFANDVKISGGLSEDKFPNKTPTDTNPMTMRSYHAGSARTLNYYGELTDSAAAGTALATGYKTMNGQLGIDYKKHPKATILEAAQFKGKATGLVATYEWMHATPASFSSHVTARADYENIYEQIENQGIDVVLGSGYGAVAKYATIQNAVDRGYTVVRTREDLEKVKPGDRIWGDATNNSSPYDINLTAEQPTLAEMTKAAITALSGDEDGFFLMVEGSKVDTGGHANDALVTTSEYLAFDAAFKVAVDFAKSRTDTVVISTPDHDTGAMMYNEIDDLEKMVSLVRSGNNPSEIGWETTNHSTQNVGVWIYVPEGTDVIDGLSETLGDTPENRENHVIENTDISPYIASLFGVNLDDVTKELFVDVTEIGRYSAAVGKFSFNSGDKYVYKNKSVYYKNGKEISMDGKVAVEIDGRIYVPSDIVEKDDWNYVSEIGANEITGSGTLDDPYIIDEAWDFIEFTGKLVLGETYEGKYLLQTKDIDVSDYSDFGGVGMKQIFAGTYNGAGHSVKVNLNVKNDESVFPKITGTVMNVNTTGSIKSEGAVNWANTGGIARVVAQGGRLVNCSSDMDIDGLNAGGLVGGNNGLVENCFFAGTVKAANKAYALSYNSYGGTYKNCYYVDTCGAEQTEDGTFGFSKDEIDAVVASLNDYKTEDKNYLWKVSEDGVGAELYILTPVVKEVIVTPSEITVNKGDGVQLASKVVGEYGPSQKVVWSVESSGGETKTKIYEDGYLCVDANETAQSFTVMAKSAIDGSISGVCKVTVGNEAASEADGTRARPYLINTESDFAQFTDAVISGKNLSGLYFEQTSDLDMSSYEGYNGMPSSASFAGIYNGKGNTVKLGISSDGDNSLFGSCTGIIMNVVSEGKVEGATRPAGICRAIRGTGIAVNCISYCDVIGGTEAAGIVRSNYNVVANCAFFGSTESVTQYKTCCVQPDGRVYNNVALGDESYSNGTESVFTQEEDFSEKLIKIMNDGREKAATLSGVPVSVLCEWRISSDGVVCIK